MVRSTVQAVLASLLLLVLALRQDTGDNKGGLLIQFAAAASSGYNGIGSSSGTGNGKGGNDDSTDGDDKSNEKKDNKKSGGANGKSDKKGGSSPGGDGKSSEKDNSSSTKKPTEGAQGRSTSPTPPSSPSSASKSPAALPMLWNTATKTAQAANEEALDLEDFNAALSRMFERRMSYHPRFRGALEEINEAMSRDLLANNEKMAPTERQRILYSLGGKGTYLEVPHLLHELRQEADHPVEEQQRIKRLHRLRRRGIPINVDDLRMRPFVRREFNGPVTTTDLEENLTDGDFQQRQTALNGWLQMQDRARQLQRQHLRHRRASRPSEPINDDDFEVDEEDAIGLSFNGKLSDEEGGDFLKEYKEYMAKLEAGQVAKRGDGDSDPEDEDDQGYDDEEEESE
ncbi:hypothetical protein ACSSS7_006830 [Eimeria intestinalis]